MIKTIIFDIGNVLTEFGWKDFIHSFHFGAEAEKKVALATVENVFWNEFDRGILNDEEMLEGFIKNDPSVESQIRAMYKSLHGIIRRSAYAVPWVRELKSKGYQVLVLSNFSDKAWRENLDSLDFMEYVDGGIISYRVKLIKPDPAIYELLLSRYGLKAEECVFLDDTKKNVDAAAKLGIRTILFQNQEQARSELAALGVK